MSLAPVVGPDEVPPAELIPARTDTDSWVTIVREVTILAQQIAETEFVPRGLRGSVPATAAAMLYGREVGLPPMTALSQIHVVEGRPGLSAEGMRALVLAAGHEIVFDETTSATCRIRGRRIKSSTWTTVEWTIDLARRAGLLRRGSAWESYPRDMLIARATTALCRMIFPDVIHGFRSVEELDDMGAPTPTSTSETPSRRARASVARRPKPASLPASPPASDPNPGGTGPAVVAGTDEGTEAPPPHRMPSLPGEEEDGGGGVGPDPTPPPSPPRHAGQVVDQQPPRDEPPADDGSDLVNRVTLKLIFGQLRRLGLGDDDQGRDARLRLLAQLANRPDLATANDLTQDEGTQVATILSTFRNADALDEFLAVSAAATIAAPIVEENGGDS